MSLFTYDFENGTNGVKVDPADTPSGGDTAFSSVTENTASGGVCKYDNTHAAHGSQSLKIATVASSVSAYVQWDTTGFGTTQYFRIYVYLTANPAANLDIIQIRDSATRARLRIDSSGKFHLVNGSTSVATSSASLALNQWVRLEYKWVANTTTGSLEAKYFATLDSTTATETLTATSLNTGSVEATNVRIGLPIAAANVGPFWLDDLGVSDTAYIGPVASGTDYTETVNDASGNTDAISTAADKARTVDDDAGLVDDATPDVPTDYTETIDDAADVSDSVSRSLLTNNYGAALKTFDFENGTVGVKVESTDTPSAGDTAFDAATENTTSGGTLKYDDTHAAHGTKSVKVATGATSTSAYVQWDTSGGGLSKYYRMYVWMDAPPAAARDILQIRDSSTRFRLRVNTDGTLSAVLGSTVVSTSTELLPFGEWGRVEYKEVVDSSAGILEFKLFGADLDGETPVETVTASALNTGTTESTNIRIGLGVAAANFGPVWIDDLAYGVEDYLGPETGAITRSGEPNDSVGLTDEMIGVVDFDGNLNENVGLTDEMTRVVPFVRTINDSAGTTDSASGSDGLAGDAGTDTTGLTDSVSRASTFIREITDSMFVTESLSSQDRATSGSGSGENFYDVPFAFYDDQPGDATIYNGTGSLASAMSGLAAGKWLVLNFDGDKTENINIAMKNNTVVVAAEGRRPFLNGNIRISGGENVKIYGLNVRNDSIGGSDHMVKLDGGSIDWGYSIVTLEDNAAGDGAYTLVRPGQSIHDWRVHHCWIHDNPGATGHNGNQDHGLYCSAETLAQNGRIDHCLIENMPEGRNIKIGGPSSGGGAIGGITVEYCTLKNGQGPSNGQVSNGATNTVWRHNLLIDSGASTNLTEGSGAGTGNTYSNNKGDSVVGPDTTRFDDAGGNTNNVSVATLTNYAAQGLLGYGHLQGFTEGSAGGTDYAEVITESMRLSDTRLADLAGAVQADAESTVDMTDEVSATLIDTVNEQTINDSMNLADSQNVESGLIQYEFRPPAVARRYLLDTPHPLFSRLTIDVSLSILKVGSSYRQVENPDPTDIAAADEFYYGGHVYTIGQAERDALVAAGYGSYITTP